MQTGISNEGKRNRCDLCTYVTMEEETLEEWYYLGIGSVKTVEEGGKGA